MMLDIKKSSFWIQLNNSFREFNDKYRLKTGYPLLLDFQPNLLIKKFEDFFEKTYRKNVIENKLWPNELPNGWILPDNWFSRINDIVRTMLVVKYLDGVEFLSKEIEIMSDQENLSCLDCEIHFEAKEEGYYAAHMYIKKMFEIPRINWDTKDITASFEIQITTQLQELIRDFLHKYYESTRRKMKKDTKWQWDYKSEEFMINYLGHILHYVEGMIVEIRDKEKENGK